jgi:hypothetical protein
MPLIQNQQVVKAFLTNWTHPTFSDSIGSRRSKRRPYNVDAFWDEDLIEAGREFAVPVMNEETHRYARLIRLPDEMTRLLSNPSRIGVCGATGEMDAQWALFDKEEDIQRLTMQRFDSKEIAREHLLSILVEALSVSDGGFPPYRWIADLLGNQPKDDAWAMAYCLIPGVPSTVDE